MNDYGDIDRIKPGHPSPAAVYDPSPIYVTGEDFIRVKTFCSDAGAIVAVRGRVLRPDNVPVPIAESIVANSNRTNAFVLSGLAEGWLLGLEVFAGGATPGSERCYVIVDLVRGNVGAGSATQGLTKGYITNNTPLIWPYGADMLPQDGPGALFSTTIGVPSAGAEFSFTFPTNSRSEVIAIQAVLNTAVAVANRQPRLFFDDGANTFYAAPLGTTIPASQVVNISWGAGAGGPIIADLGVMAAPIPNNVFMAGGFRLRSVTGALQAADQWNGIFLLRREWIDV